MIRRKFKDFAEIRRRIDELISAGLPATRTGGDQQTNHIRFESGAIITLAAIKTLIQIDDYLGHQYTEVTIDEAPSFPFIASLIDKVKGCLRSPHGVPCHLFMTGNPGGPGANSVKMLYIKKAAPNTPFRTPEGSTAIFIPSSLADNKVLCQRDPGYVRRLQSIKDPALRAAWLLGDWDAFIGQAFDFSQDYHVVPILPIPRGAPMYMTFDWGFGAPFSVGWWWVDGDGRVYRCAEWYGWDGVTPNVGLRLEDSRIAQGIKDREERLEFSGRNIIRLGSHDSWNKKPNYEGGGQGPSTAEVFTRHGIFLIKADPSRHLKIRQFRERLKVEYLNLDEIAKMLGLRPYVHELLGPCWIDGAGNHILERKLVEMARQERMQLQYVRPMMQVYSRCRDFIRTVPSLCVDETDVEDIDTEQEDHCYDDAAQICMARPLSMEEPRPKKLQSDAHIDKMERPTMRGSYEEEAYRDQIVDMRFWEHQGRRTGADYGYMPPDDFDYGDRPIDGGRTYSDVDGR
ncbi:MAG: hypothetical protein LLG06_19695 [Desulfobacteraceae bacterium]|nr:hypothetical protein [Desulfobacteraceae bacterium]